jgi:hypothetical protein
LGNATAVRVDTDPTFNGGRHLEGTWKDRSSGRLYGWYHNELDHVQGRGAFDKRYPCVCQIGAMVSEDDGLTWRDQGLVITPPADSFHTAETTRNPYYVGGVGDFGVCPDKEGRFVYFFAVSFHKHREHQGLTVYRMDLADRDQPAGKVLGWREGRWSEPGLEGRLDPIFPVTTDWHGPSPAEHWGPVIHWNTHLQQYVMVLNRVKDTRWLPEGYYVSFNRDLADPRGWSTPVKFLDGEEGRRADPKKYDTGWYATAIGVERGETGTEIGSRARFFCNGRSRWEITFEP